jgi:hypothetical protein
MLQDGGLKAGTITESLHTKPIARGGKVETKRRGHMILERRHHEKQAFPSVSQGKGLPSLDCPG